MRAFNIRASALFVVVLLLMLPVMGSAAVTNYFQRGTNAVIIGGTMTIGSGATVTAANVPALNGGVSIGGGYGSTGVTISSAGVVQANGALTVDGASTLTGAVTMTAGIANYKIATINTDATGAVAVTAGDTGELFIATKADGATTYTLPDPSAATVGCVWIFTQTADQAMNIVPTTADGNSIIADGVATSDKVSIETAGHKIGGAIKIIGISATKYLAVADSGATMTVEAAD